MHTYKLIYMYAYILCTKKSVVIFVVIVWKLRWIRLKSLKEIICEDYSKRIIWEESFKKDHLKRIIWGKENSEREIFDKEDRNRILRKLRYQTWANRRVLLIEILSIRVVCLNIPFRSLLSKISFSLSFSSNDLFQMIFLKWSSSNDLSQMIFLKWFSSNNSRK
jgi:hypothetical protein